MRVVSWFYFQSLRAPNPRSFDFDLHGVRHILCRVVKGIWSSSGNCAVTDRAWQHQSADEKDDAIGEESEIG
ncbi:MAG TPA: hypothetical protein VMU41_03405 [Candidatus Binataceae bacterium]|nr:hypothetical protein [Candidatus Binataceae bacterium]